jgi:hypothetical protein
MESFITLRRAGKSFKHFLFPEILLKRLFGGTPEI